MKIKVGVTRKVNLGNYQSKDFHLDLEAEIPDESFADGVAAWFHTAQVAVLREVPTESLTDEERVILGLPELPDPLPF